MDNSAVSRRRFLEKTFKAGAFAMVGAFTFSAVGCDKFGDNIYAVDADKCDGCGDCLSACGFGAITISDVASISSSKCAGCGKCVSYCDNGAIYKG